MACNTCTRTCIDRHDDCPGWTSQGECFKNPAFMRDSCPMSCGICPDGTCADKSADCKAWASSGECQSNPTFVMHECPDACGLCENICQDQHEQCSTWAADGNCETNHAYMLSQCPASCGTCGRIRAVAKFGDGADWPVEAATGGGHDEV